MQTPRTVEGCQGLRVLHRCRLYLFLCFAIFVLASRTNVMLTQNQRKKRTYIREVEHGFSLLDLIRFGLTTATSKCEETSSSRVLCVPRGRNVLEERRSQWIQTMEIDTRDALGQDTLHCHEIVSCLYTGELDATDPQNTWVAFRVPTILSTLA